MKRDHFPVTLLSRSALMRFGVVLLCFAAIMYPRVRPDLSSPLQSLRDQLGMSSAEGQVVAEALGFAASKIVESSKAPAPTHSQYVERIPPVVSPLIVAEEPPRHYRRAVIAVAHALASQRACPSCQTVVDDDNAEVVREQEMAVIETVDGAEIEGTESEGVGGDICLNDLSVLSIQTLADEP